MKTASPLRYPGGKSAMADLLCQIRKINRFGDRITAEPFAGGAGASLSLLFLEESPEIYINDADPAIFDFWWALINRSKNFENLISNARLDMTEWKYQRKVYKSNCRISRLHRGFSVFYLNRCNRSGIIVNGGPIGGVEQEGRWKINARFNKCDLLNRCKRIAEYRDRISVSCQDGIQFINKYDNRDMFFFIDPPYFEKGKTLYLNALDEKYHFALGQQLRNLERASWVLTYDDCPEIRNIYEGWATIKPFSLRYNASARRTGNEVLIAPKWIALPAQQKSDAIVW